MVGYAKPRIMTHELIGRAREMDLLSTCVEEERSHFVVVYGRRRVGKTFLIRKYFKNQFSFYATGLANADMNMQLTALHTQLMHTYAGVAKIRFFDGIGMGLE